MNYILLQYLTKLKATMYQTFPQDETLHDVSIADSVVKTSLNKFYTHMVFHRYDDGYDILTHKFAQIIYNNKDT